jgi:lysophospholipase L1-like esterase
MRQLFLKTGLAEEYKPGSINAPLYQLEDEGQKWQLMFRLLSEFNAVVRENGAEFLLVHVPSKEASPGNPQGYRGILKGTVDQNNRFSETLRAFAAGRGIHFLDMLEPVRKGHAAQKTLYNPSGRDIHLNAEGHRLLADSILSWLREQGWPEARVTRE